ncbi:DUF5067 domain-containing protein [Lederbergia citri]|uniref:DUF5067 domain-containing protein n=1 Tax=Lederbergia citri TaxID=2833580 RepID=A0A942TD87_9BACI|nr:DUF5067 domain-containing protein [Lederbergia citri]MBS4194671.1 DUF5067 domain-containing protein [Lederbergia citri]
MKKLIVALLSFGMLTGCVQYKDGKPVVKDNESPKESKQEQPKAKEEKPKVEKQPKETSHKITVDEKLLFGELTVNFQQVEIKDNKAIITFSWINQAGDGKKFFFALMGIDVMQNDVILDEVSGAYDAANKNTSDVYFHNAEGGEKKVTLEYELKNKEAPINISFTPYNGIEDSQSLTIDIN